METDLATEAAVVTAGAWSVRLRVSVAPDPTGGERSPRRAGVHRAKATGTSRTERSGLGLRTAPGPSVRSGDLKGCLTVQAKDARQEARGGIE